MTAVRKLLLGICGGIAAYKSAELVRRLRESDCQVRVMMTAAAQSFVGALTFQALSGNRVHTGFLDEAAEAAMGHIELARWADLCLIAPATADFIAKLAHGRADDLPSAVCLASSAPLIVAPAMNQQMWLAAATQENISLLRRRGVEIWGPAEGAQACGEVGPGRMLEPDDLAERVLKFARQGVLNGHLVLITAGPTREPLDPVRYISNRSSGKMGFALARACREQGAEVILVTGPCAQPTPPGVKRVDVETAEQMLAAVMGAVDSVDVFIAAAAVADYGAPAQPHKIQKRSAELKLTLTKTADIVAAVASLGRAPFTVGFAAETEDLERNALAKLHGKALNMIAANAVGEGETGFDSDYNTLTVFWPDGRRDLPRTDKLSLARQLVTLIAERIRAHNSSSQDPRSAVGR
jgi:phosphopantothenoylcysteine decarboxylase/phosphopantothenate--cysteine ligase